MPTYSPRSCTAGPTHSAAEILRRRAEAGGDHSRFLLVEGVIPDRPSADEASFDLFMLTLSGGRQRTLDEFRRLGESADQMLQSSQVLSTRTRSSS
jgi:hypothetical protein